MTVLRWGTGQTALVLLHGVGGGCRAWEAHGPALAAAGYLAVAPDLPGYGDAPSIEPYDMAGLAAAVLGLLDELAAPRAVLVGHSMGGMVAQEVVARAPDRIAGLVVSGATAAFGKPTGAWQQQFLEDRLAPLDAGAGMAALAPSLVVSMAAPRAARAALEFAMRLLAAVPEATYRRALAAIVGFDRRADLPRIAVPTLCIAGRHDQNATPAAVQRMALRIPGAESLCLDGAGHLAPIEVPEAFDRALLSFLNRHFGDPT